MFSVHVFAVFSIAEYLTNSLKSHDAILWWAVICIHLYFVITQNSTSIASNKVCECVCVCGVACVHTIAFYLKSSYYFMIIILIIVIIIIIITITSLYLK